MNLYEFEAGLVYMVDSRPVRIHSETLLKGRKKEEKEKRKSHRSGFQDPTSKVHKELPASGPADLGRDVAWVISAEFT